MNIRNELAEHIRRSDPGNRLSPERLGVSVAFMVARRFPVLTEQAVAGFVEQVNPGKTMGAAALADAVVDRFDLDCED